MNATTAPKGAVVAFLLHSVERRIAVERGKVRRCVDAAWPFLPLCVLGSSRWLLESARPDTAANPMTQAAGSLLAAGLAGLWALRFGRRGTLGSRPRDAWTRVVAAGFTIAGPSLWALVSDRYINAENATVALALVPVVVAVAEPAFGAAVSSELAARLWPGLAGVTGLLLVVPQPVFTDWRFTMALAGMPVVCGTCAAFVSARRAVSFGEGSGERDVFFSAKALLVSTVSFAVTAGWAYRGQDLPRFSWPAAGLDGLSSLCMLAVLTRLGSVRWSAQFFLIPLLTLLEGVVFLRPVLDARSWVAFALLAVSSAYLLFANARDVPVD